MAGIRKFFESLAYAGLKPSQRGAAPLQERARSFWDRLLSGPMPADPLYLSNRTWKQKLRVALLVSAPVAIVLAAAAYTILTPPTPVEKRPSELSPAEIAARTPIIPKDFRVQQSNELQIVEVAVDRSGGPGQLAVAGTLKNNTGRLYSGAELTFDLTDENGSQVGGVSTRVAKVEPRGTVRFRFAIPQRNADSVLVREIRSFF